MQIALFGGKQSLKFEKYLSVEASMRFKGLAHAGLLFRGRAESAPKIV